MSEQPSWEELNAYVDGELAADDAARVARALADTPSLADDVARLAQMKAAVKDIPPEMPKIELPAPGETRWDRIAAAAVVVAVMTGLVGYALWPFGSREASGLAGPRAVHAAWARASANGQLQAPPAAAFLAASRAFGPGVHVPDLSAARLSIVMIARVAPEKDRPGGLHVGYAGTRGCRVSLWVAAAADRAAPPLTHHYGDAGESYEWGADGLLYAMFADGMESERFGVIAQAAYKATQERQELDPVTRTALRRSRETSPPCAG